MIQERKRVKSYSQMINAYEDSCLKISNRYCSEMSKLTQDSISTLCHLFRSYLTNKKIMFDDCQSTQVKSTLDSSHKPIRAGAKHIYEEDSAFYLPASVQKTKQNDCKSYQNLILSNQIKKMSLGSNLLLEDSDEEDEPAQKVPNLEELKHKNLAQIIMQSQKKVEKKQQLMKQNQMIQQSDSNYEITDHSSNQSSNEGDSYTAYYIENEDNSNKPLFNGLFTKTLSSDSMNSNSSNLLNFKFQSKEMLMSPKKLTKSKRLYVGSKKIPRWAEDLAEVERKCAKQDINGTSIFGKCVVQKLNTNVIFHWKKQTIKRTSSAKWNSQMFFT